MHRNPSPQHALRVGPVWELTIKNIICFFAAVAPFMSPCSRLLSGNRFCACSVSRHHRITTDRPQRLPGIFSCRHGISPVPAPVRPPRIVRFWVLPCSVNAPFPSLALPFVRVSVSTHSLRVLRDFRPYRSPSVTSLSRFPLYPLGLCLPSPCGDSCTRL